MFIGRVWTVYKESMDCVIRRVWTVYKESMGTGV